MVRTAQTHRSKPRKSKPMNDLIPIKGQRKVILGELTSPIEKGDIIFSTTPIFPTLISELLSSHCSGCLKTAQQISEDSNIDIDKVEERMLKCSRCQVHVFCSVKCYASTWCSLNDECRGLANNPGWIPNTIARLVAKVLSSRRFGRELYDPLPDYPDTNFTHVNEETLKIHDSVIQLLAQPKYEGETLIYTVQFCQYHIDEDDGFETLMGRISSCLLTLYDTSANPVGMGLSPQFIEDSPLLQT
ncbi:hypothetical protein I203_103774 [Kwoniella mangroviensis CBS 8507]|uniref:uncharacterized protein n=1 Tax=Kwoniella mangroviensis CBS 8507 TaxID=1296122 RepID=UPI0030628AA6